MHPPAGPLHKQWEDGQRRRADGPGAAVYRQVQHKEHQPQQRPQKPAQQQLQQVGFHRPQGVADLVVKGQHNAVLPGHPRLAEGVNHLAPAWLKAHVGQQHQHGQQVHHREIHRRRPCNVQHLARRPGPAAGAQQQGGVVAFDKGCIAQQEYQPQHHHQPGVGLRQEEGEHPRPHGVAPLGAEVPHRGHHPVDVGQLQQKHHVHPRVHRPLLKVVGRQQRGLAQFSHAPASFWPPP